MMSGTGQKRINELAAIEFRSKRVGQPITEYAKKAQRLARDLAAEFDRSARDARQAMYGLRSHPALLGVDVKARARMVARKLKRAKECAVGISGESIKFQLEYRRQFVAEAERTEAKTKRRKVDL